MHIQRIILCGLFLVMSGCSRRQSQAVPQPVIPEGALADPQIHFEFAIYYIHAPSTEPLATLAGLLASDFSDIQRVEKLSAKDDKMHLAVHLLSDVAKSYTAPSPEMLQRFGRGLSKEQADGLQKSEQVLILDFGYPNAQAWEKLRSACKLLSELGRRTGGMLWDEETREMFTPDTWDERRLRGWESGAPDVSRHIVIHAYNKGEFTRAITLGMAKMGLPDVVVDNFSWSANRQIGILINVFAQALVEGARFEKAGEYDLDLKSLANAQVRDRQLSSLMKHATGRAQLSLRRGTQEEGDPRNRLIEITFDRYPGRDIHAQQDRMIGTLFGWQDSIKSVEHNEELEAASQRAKDKLPTLQAAFVKGLKPGEYIELKAPFDIPTGGHEFMWIEVTAWNDDKIKGLLKNEPFHIPSLHGGQIVEFDQGSVFDYIRRFPDGSQEGNETGAILEKMPGAEEQR